MKKLLPFTLIIFLFAFQDAGNGKKANKTIKDSVFAVGDVIKLPTINWYAPSAYGEMNPNTKDTLNLIGDFLIKNPGITVEVTSHTDFKGSDDYNNRLSQERAKAVVNYLTGEKKVEPTRVTPKGVGEAFLLVTEEEVKKAPTKAEKEALHQKNIRIELVVTQVN